ncbi:MAG: ABC transporter ATP-binding protein [Patescibacteria group bacterium]|nr:ABC transporter ATP-binding protein [Patescibacteria group bacterium]
MNDELRQMLQGEKAPKRTVVNPRLRTTPRVQGGLPLDGGPRLDLDAPASRPAPAAHAKPASAVGHASILATSGVVAATAGNLGAKGVGGTASKGVASGTAGTGGPHITLASPRVKPPEPEPRRQPAVIEPAALKGPQLKTIGLTKSFRKGDIEIPVLRGVDLEVEAGELLAVVGQSGSGKSTLLHLLCTLDVPDRGEIHFEGQRIDRLPPAQRDQLRNRRFGMVFQFYHLLPELNTLENVLCPLMIRHSAWNYFRHRRAMRERAEELLQMVGLSHRLNHKPRELSGGEMQRAAIARALISQPDLLLADEPTGNLDHATGTEILNLLRTLNDQHGLTIVMVTHDPAIAQLADRTIRLADGRIQW